MHHSVDIIDLTYNDYFNTKLTLLTIALIPILMANLTLISEMIEH